MQWECCAGMRGACRVSILLTCSFSLLKEIKSSAEHDNDDKVLKVCEGTGWN